MQTVSLSYIESSLTIGSTASYFQEIDSIVDYSRYHVNDRLHVSVKLWYSSRRRGAVIIHLRNLHGPFCNL